MLALTVAAFALLGLSMVYVAVDDGTDAADSGNITWEITSNVLLITKKAGATEGTMSDYTAGNAPWKDNATSITSVDIREGITSIGKYAFNGCTALKTVSMSDVTSIGEGAFRGCVALESISPLTGVTEIGDNAFNGCKKITKMVLSAVTSVGDNAFKNCEKLYWVDLSSATTIKSYAFEGCNALSYLSFASNITSLEPAYAFPALKFYDGNTQLTTVTADTLKGKVWLGSGDTAAKSLYNSTGKTSEYIIYFAVDGGTTTSERMITVDQKLPSLPTATKDSIGFRGWFEASGTSPVTTSTTFTGSKELTAKFGNANPVTGVTIDPTTKQLSINETFNLTVTVSPANATDKTYELTSDDEAVASVDSNGKVTAYSTGTAMITVTTNDGSFEATCTVTVTDTPITSVTLNESEIVVSNSPSNARNTFKLIATLLPATASNKDVTWTTSNSAVATVNTAGLVTGVSTGEATITATSVVSGKTATCLVHVASKLVEGFSLSPATCNLDVGGTATLETTFTPSDASVKKIIWTSSNPSKATVSNDGVVKGLGAGTVTITATTVDGKISKICTITLADVPIKSISIDKASAEVSINKTVELKVSFDPTNASNKTINWSSSNNSIATVNENGVVKGIAEGEVTITGTSAADSTKKVTCTVKVLKIGVTSVAIDPIDPIEVDQSVPMKAIVNPETASDTSVKWSINDTTIATIGEKTGIITGVKPGTVTVTATSNSDSTKTAQCTVTVTKVQTAEASYTSIGNEAVVLSPSLIIAEIDVIVDEGFTPRVEVDTSDETVVNTVEVPMEIVTKLKDVSGAMLKINTAQGSIEIPSGGLSKLDTTKSDVSFSIKSKAIPEKYKDAGFSKVSSVEVLYDDEVKPTEFGTNAKFSIAYELAEGESVNDLRVAYLPDNGNPQIISGATYKDGFVYFESSHNSDYAISFKAIPGEGDTTMTIIIIIAIVIVIGIVFFYLYRFTDVLQNLKSQNKGPKNKGGSGTTGTIRPIRKP